MVSFKRGLSLLLQLGRKLYESENTTEEPIQTELPTADPTVEPMMVYWEKDQSSGNQPFIDIYLKGKALERIPDATEGPVKESHYGFGKLFYNLPKQYITPETTETSNIITAGKVFLNIHIKTL